jgi:hypothetical protein
MKMKGRSGQNHHRLIAFIIFVMIVGGIAMYLSAIHVDTMGALPQSYVFKD